MVLKHSKEFKSKDVKTKGYYTVILFIVLLLFDRITKLWATSLQNEKNYGILAFTYVTNTGAGFSILKGMNIWLAIISIIVLIVIIYFHKEIPKFSLITIISGIVGNTIDRIFYGSVIDFINLKFWPIFNIADSLIFIGVAYWIIILLRENKESKEDNNKIKNKNSKKK
jgi:signal peptidase II